MYFSRGFGDSRVTTWKLCVLWQKQSEEEFVCSLSNLIHLRGEGAYNEVISLADLFQNVDATPILMLNIETKSPCEKSCILTPYMPSVVQYVIA